MSADKLPACLQATEDDIQLLLAAQCHIGTKNCDKTMEPYVYKRRADGELACGVAAWNGAGLDASWRGRGRRSKGEERGPKERGKGKN
jgi:hypothetical protein